MEEARDGGMTGWGDVLDRMGKYWNTLMIKGDCEREGCQGGGEVERCDLKTDCDNKMTNILFKQNLLG